METWGWIIVYLVGFALFQLLLFRYFADDSSVNGASFGSSEASAPRTVDRAQPIQEPGRQVAGERDDDEDEDGVHCRQCGAFNDDEQTYTYCRECLAQLR